jgi:hypothetical protein
METGGGWCLTGELLVRYLQPAPVEGMLWA